jgi:hypothetical protein
MKILRLVFAFLIFESGSVRLFSQDISIDQGNFKILVAEKNINIKVSFNNLQVGRYKNESDYVNKRVAEINKKYPGKGDEWLQRWNSQKMEEFVPAFINAFKLSSGKDTSSTAAYTLIFNTSYLEPGFSSSAILVRKDPEIRGELLLVRSDDSTQVIVKARLLKAVGKAGPHFETGDHIDSAYTEAGEAVGAFILNN